MYNIVIIGSSGHARVIIDAVERENKFRIAGIIDTFIVNTKASLDHDGIMGASSSFAPAVTAGGEVTIKPFAAVLLGANIIHGISTGEHSVVGAGSLVLSNVPDRVVAYGLPARIIRTRQPGEPYLKVKSGFLVCRETVALDK
jgi:acetyltransferase-like isoleucine patch superfamily enzyme